MFLALSLISAFLDGEPPVVPQFPHAEMQNATGTPVIFPKSESELSDKTKVPSQKPQSPNDQILSLSANALFEMLKGNWDNELQVFFEPEMGVEKSKSHKRLHISLSTANSNEFGDFALLVEYFEGSEHGNVLRSRIWGVSPDYVNNQIIVTQFEPKPGADYTAPKSNQFSALKGCEIVFSPHAGGFSGAINPNSCKIKTKNNETLSLYEKQEISEKNWFVSDLAKDEKGKTIFATSDNSPNKYKKAEVFTCWASGYDGKEFKTKSNVKIHNQGGIANIKLGAKSIRLKLRDVVWPMGENRPSLTLYLLLGKDDYSDIYAWTESDAKRIALAYGDYQASCTRD